MSRDFKRNLMNLTVYQTTLSPLTAIGLEQLLGFMSKTVFIISAGLPF